MSGFVTLKLKKLNHIYQKEISQYIEEVTQEFDE